MLDNKIPPLAIGLACGALIYLARDLWRIQFVFQVHVAVLLLVAGLVIMILGIVEFRRSRTTFNPLQPEAASTLVQTGVFRFSRNPMYLGFLGILLAWTVFLGAVAGLAILVLFVTWMNAFQIAAEERAMTKLFGADYAEYRERVRRWL